MKKYFVLALTIGGLLQTAGPSWAGWDNVFQVCCRDCRPRERTSFSAPTQQEVRYEQRCYYEPVTVMKAERYTEEVPVQVKSYYWDPVTTYSRASYYDSCTGCRQEVCVPRTSYVRKEQCNTVTKYVERMRMVPTQVNRKVCEKRPVVTYYGPTTKSYDCDTCGDVPAASHTAPRIEELRSPPTVTPETNSTILPQTLPTIPQSLPKTMPPASRYTGPVNARTTSFSMPAAVRGEVVLKDQHTPRAGAKLVFVNVKNQQAREYTTTDAYGRFDLNLTPGEWYVYVGNGDGRANYHEMISLNDRDRREFKVVSR